MKVNSLPLSDIVTVALFPMTDNLPPSKYVTYKLKNSSNSGSGFERIVTLLRNSSKLGGNVTTSSTC